MQTAILALKSSGYPSVNGILSRGRLLQGRNIDVANHIIGVRLNVTERSSSDTFNYSNIKDAEVDIVQVVRLHSALNLTMLDLLL